MTYYVIYLPGNVYTNTYSSGFAEVAACFLGGVLIKFCNPKCAFAVSNSISLIGGLLILFFETSHPHLIPVYVIIAKFGISAANTIVYAVTIPLFPTLYVARALAICSVSANITTIITPYLAQMKDPYPMLVYNSIAVVGVILSFFI